ncbi:antibiotic biosynthesis monooxygenase [Streptomyces sp. NPDC096310]|uniref:antibiotic biosynthesis monooxygenase n=1 Tax=Streptomyces sp. NPDC096310 TaxID=3366082 RepID=UPI00380708E9
MSVRLSTLPDFTRRDAGVATVSTWRVGTLERQRAAVEAITHVWRSRAWPDGGPLSYSVLTGNDGETLLHYAQWRDQASYQAFAATDRDERVAEIDAAVPGIERMGLRPYALYRAQGLTGQPDGTPLVPGCVVAVDVEFEGPDPVRQRDWVDTVRTAIETDPHLAPGGISAFFHVSTDGTRVLNLAGWVSEQAHVDALSARGRGIGSDTEQWRAVRNHPGVRGSTVTRFTPAVSLSSASDTAG